LRLSGHSFLLFFFGGMIVFQFKGRVALPRPTFEVSTGKKADIGLGGGLQVNLDEVNVLVDI